MKFNRDMLRLYAVTDRSWLNGHLLSEQVAKAIKGGVTFMQLREKDMSFDAFMKEAVELAQLCKNSGIPFVINDNVDVALACDADGVHVGQRDMLAREARKKLGPHKILGVSVRTVGQAVLAQENGADYLGVGAVFATSTKQDADAVSIETLKEICATVSIPVVAIGGISQQNILQLKNTGIAGVAVVSALFAQPDIEAAAKMLFELSADVVLP